MSLGFLRNTQEVKNFITTYAVNRSETRNKKPFITKINIPLVFMLRLANHHKTSVHSLLCKAFYLDNVCLTGYDGPCTTLSTKKNPEDPRSVDAKL